MVDMKKEQERDELHRAIWAIADELRGSVDGWDFKAYVLGCILKLLNTVQFYQKGTSAALHSLAFHQGVRRSCALHLHLSGELFSILDFSDTP